jgi:hypothetical protein
MAFGEDCCGRILVDTWQAASIFNHAVLGFLSSITAAHAPLRIPEEAGCRSRYFVPGSYSILGIDLDYRGCPEAIGSEP